MKRNLVEQGVEEFKPPVFKPNTSTRNRVENRLRRFLDLQAGSAWIDLERELATAHGSLIDIGCGAQVFRELVPAGVEYHGIDTVEAKAKFGYEIPDTHYFEGEDWGIGNKRYDMALCTEVLEHIVDPAAFLAKACDCLRPGGRLVLTVPFAARWHFVPYDYWRYTPSSLKLLLDRAGFDQVRVQARGNPTTVACYKAMAVLLILLFGVEQGGWRLLNRALGVLLLPVLGLVACIANISLLTDWGEDCLGYTVFARRQP